MLAALILEENLTIANRKRNFSITGGVILIFDNIARLCKDRHISIARLEREIGVGNATIRGWKHASPTVEKLKLVADYFGCTVDDLLKEVR